MYQLQGVVKYINMVLIGICIYQLTYTNNYLQLNHILLDEIKNSMNLSIPIKELDNRNDDLDDDDHHDHDDDDNDHDDLNEDDHDENEFIDNRNEFMKKLIPQVLSRETVKPLLEIQIENMLKINNEYDIP